MDEQVSPSRVALLGEHEVRKSDRDCRCPAVPLREEESSARIVNSNQTRRGTMTRWWEVLDVELGNDTDCEDMHAPPVPPARGKVRGRDMCEWKKVCAIAAARCYDVPCTMNESPLSEERAIEMVERLTRAGCGKNVDEMRRVVEQLKLGWLLAYDRETMRPEAEHIRARVRVLLNRLTRAGFVRVAIEYEMRCVMQLLRIGWIAECRHRNKTRMDAEMARAEMVERAWRKRVMRLARTCMHALNQSAVQNVFHAMRRYWGAAMIQLAELADEEAQSKRIQARHEAKTQRKKRQMLGRARYVGMMKSKYERALMCWKQLRTEHTEQQEVKSDGLSKAFDAAMDRNQARLLARVWLRLVGAFWLEKEQSTEDGWLKIEQLTAIKNGGGQRAVNDEGYDRSCTKCGWGGWLVHAGKHVCRKCEYQVESWCKEAEIWAEGGTDGGEELLAQAPQARNVMVCYSRRQVLMRARLLMAIRNRQVSIWQREVLHKFREGYKQGKLVAVVGEWRDGKVQKMDERSIVGEVRIPRPRAGAADREKLKKMVEGIGIWFGNAECVWTWRGQTLRDKEEHRVELEHKLEMERLIQVAIQGFEKQQHNEQKSMAGCLKELSKVAPSALSGAPSARPKTQKKVTFRVKTSRTEQCEQLIAQVLRGQAEEARLIATVVRQLADQKVAKT
jgi:hypothetical protein